MANALPRWRGFNLLDMYGYEPGRELIRPGDLTGPGGYGGGDGDFREADFQWIADWGFDFVRIPMDYRYWTQFDDRGSWTLRENVMARIDRVLELGDKYGLHVSLDFHRAPGYCVNPPAESSSLWSDLKMQTMFAAQWRIFAERYRGIPPERLSFDLVNEPPAIGIKGLLSGGGMTREAHQRVIIAAVTAIAGADPQRRIIINGLNYGNEPLLEFTGLARTVAQSCRAYLPFGVTHYKAHWVSYPWLREPRWPGADHFGRTWDRSHLEAHYAQWAKLAESGVGVHCGEGGAFSKTPHAVVLAWLKDVLEILRGHGIGWALWNFRGDFGPLDSNRTDVAYEDWHGHKLDRGMLELLRAS